MSSLAYAAADTAVIAKRNLLRIPRQPDLWVSFTIQPLMFVLLFVYVFGGAIQTPGYDDYVDFLMPGILALSIMISAVIGLSTIMVDWRQRGILRRLKLTPIPLAEFFAARITASLVVAMLQLPVLLAFGRVVFGIHISSTAWAAIPVAVAGCLCFLAMGFAIGSVVSNPETGDAVSNVITNPMMFLSGTFFPVAAMPAYVQAIARLLPLYYMANGLRDTTVRGLSITHVIPDIAVLLLVTAILSVVALRSFRWEPSI